MMGMDACFISPPQHNGELCADDLSLTRCLSINASSANLKRGTVGVKWWRIISLGGAKRRLPISMCPRLHLDVDVGHARAVGRDAPAYTESLRAHLPVDG